MTNGTWAHICGCSTPKKTVIVLHLDHERDRDWARLAFETHLARARWMTKHGYRHLLRGGAPH